MFGIGWTELLIIAIVAIIVVGPKDLPRLMRTFGHYAGKLRRMANEFKHQVDEAMREAELVEVRKAMHDFHAQASDINLHAPVDKPLMVPKPAPPAPAEAAEPASKPEPKPRAKTPKMAGAKKTAAAGTADVAKPKPAPKPRARKRKEQTP